MSKELIVIRQVAKVIRVIRGEKVLFDFDLAPLYGVTTGNLNKATQRNRERFPSDFMFQLTAAEAESLIFQFGRAKGRVGKHDKEINAIIEAIRQLMAPPEKPKREIGFHVHEQAPRYRTRK
jgi:hypothetical protein